MAQDTLRSCLENHQTAQFGVKKRLKMLIYSSGKLCFIPGILPSTLTGQRCDASLFKIAPGDFVSPISALSYTRLKTFPTASKTASTIFPRPRSFLLFCYTVKIMTPVRDNHHLVQRPTEPEMPEQRTETTGAAVEHISQLATKQDLESLVAAMKEEMGTLRGDIERFQGATRTDIELLREELDKRIDNFGPKIERVQSMLKQKVEALHKHVDSELRIIRLIVGAVFLGVLMTILKLFIP